MKPQYNPVSGGQIFCIVVGMIFWILVPLSFFSLRSTVKPGYLTKVLIIPATPRGAHHHWIWKSFVS
jgi:hypothetical protein